MSAIRGENRKNLVLFLILFSITFSFSISFYLAMPDYSLIGKSDREKLLELLPEYYELIYFAYDLVEPESSILFLEHEYYYYAQPLYYPRIHCEYLPRDQEDITDGDVLNYIKNNDIDYIAIFFIEFPLSTNSTYFTKHELDLTRYILEINRTAL